ncbi:hypothetical protein [Eoetvoesiella caeni]|uniref:Uncharacterized protein n=1 Tax=Eoetvoesiella caeni TaxID=645616 RepID=A0A366H164_9BURK|nr:hypothetical protein [Eoetvoesiella caeni]MCI2811235.1 hypothetical protein [Eoetvoesiella caeni]NYT57115.1 hypothetical protein [Eoetvoesiella caeni]RBP34103.1 hypothetical protein DFR37_1246 [Eoetvoesiella caeni]
MAIILAFIAFLIVIFAIIAAGFTIALFIAVAGVSVLAFGVGGGVAMLISGNNDTIAPVGFLAVALFWIVWTYRNNKKIDDDRSK